MGDLFSPLHIIVLLVIALLIFGPKRLPEIGSGLGKSIREFKQSMNNMTSQDPTPPNTNPESSSQEYPAHVVPHDDTTIR